MNTTTTIRAELEEFIEREGISFSQLSKKAGLNAGTISSILKGNRVMGVDQLDRMTAVLGLPPGHYYEQYIRECILSTVPNWRRVRPLIYRCAELDKLDCIRTIADLLLDKLTYSPLLFEVAEDFYTHGYFPPASVLYESVASSERRQHSERLAFCQYRLFTLQLGDDQEWNLQAALQFEPFVERLDEMSQLDALRELANVYRVMRRWDKVDKLAALLGEKAAIQLHLAKQSKGKRRERRPKPKRPLFVYLAYSHLLRGSVCNSQGDYLQGMKYSTIYADLSWVKGTDEETRKWIRRYEEWARVNIYISRLMIGEEEVLHDYVDYIRTNTSELLVGLLNITVAANLYDYSIEAILEQFERQIDDYAKAPPEDSAGQCGRQPATDQITRLFCGLSQYYLRNGLYERGFHFLLTALLKALLINNETYILTCVRLFEQYRGYASLEVERQYQHFVSEDSFFDRTFRKMHSTE